MIRMLHLLGYCFRQILSLVTRSNVVKLSQSLYVNGKHNILDYKMRLVANCDIAGIHAGITQVGFGRKRGFDFP